MPPLPPQFVNKLRQQHLLLFAKVLGVLQALKGNSWHRGPPLGGTATWEEQDGAEQWQSCGHKTCPTKTQQSPCFTSLQSWRCNRGSYEEGRAYEFCFPGGLISIIHFYIHKPIFVSNRSCLTTYISKSIFQSNAQVQLKYVHHKSPILFPLIPDNDNRPAECLLTHNRLVWDKWHLQVVYLTLLQVQHKWSGTHQFSGGQASCQRRASKALLLKSKF